MAIGLRTRAELTHHESASRGNRDNPREVMEYRKQWGQDRDPFYNPNHAIDNERFPIGTRRTGVRLPASWLPVRVLFCSHNLNLEGAPHYLYWLALELASRGRIEPEVLSPVDGPLAAKYRDAGIPVHVFDFRASDSDPRQGLANNIRHFADWIRESNFEVVHCNTLNTFLAINAAHEAGVPSIWTIHESVDYRHYFQQFGPNCAETALRAFSHIYQAVFTAHATRGMFRPLETEHHFNVIHHGLRIDAIEAFVEAWTPEAAREALGCPQGKLVVTIIGTVCERKGQQIFAQAALELLRGGRQDVVFYIVGARPSPYQEQLQQMIADHAEIHLIEETHDVHLYFRASDIFVVCSNNESFPVVILEAMTFRLPIVTTCIYGIAEQVVNEISALTFPVGDVAKLVQHLTRLLDNPSERKKLGEAAFCALNSMVSEAEMVQEYERIYFEAVVTGSKNPVQSRGWPAAKSPEPRDSSTVS